MALSKQEIKKLLKKKVFTRKAPTANIPVLEVVNSVNERKEARPPNEANKLYISQDQLLCELDPNSHDINNKALYPDKIKGEGNERQIVFIARVALALQEFIANRQAIHMWANPLTFKKSKKSNQDIFDEFTEYWKFNNTDEYALEVLKSSKKTGDGAMVLYFDEDKELSYKTLSYLDGDALIPHYKSNGALDKFIRRFSDSDEEGDSVDAIEIWDSTKYSKYHYKDDEWTIQGKEEAHGFTRVPVAYHREGDAAWGSVQGLIDKLERSLSDFRDSNSYFTYGILFLAGTNIDVLPDKTTQGKVITSTNPEAKANLLEQGDVAPGFKFEYETYLQQIKDLTGTVIIDPEDFKGGDVSGATIKSYYDPAIQQALLSKPVIQPFIKTLIKLVKEAYGIQHGKASDMKALSVKGEIDPYVPRNSYEENQMLNESVSMGSLSKQTASERNKLSAADEYSRIQKETEDEERRSNQASGAKGVTEEE